MYIQGDNGITRDRLVYELHKDEKYNFPIHIHHNPELILILKGQIEVTVNGRKEIAREGQFILIFPFQKHFYSSDTVSTFMIYTFPRTMMADFAASISDKVGKNSVFNASPLTLEMFKQRLGNEPTLTPYTVRSCMYAMLEDFSSQVELIQNDNDTQAIDKLIYHVNKNYKEPLPLHEVARALGYSANYLSHFISKTLGYNYNTFLGSVRAEHAKLMLKETELSVLEIALECGYQNIRCFQRYFKNYIGVSPSEYRKAHEEPRDDDTVLQALSPQVIRRIAYI